jgi:Secretion system C-terminal sorting domain
MYAMRLLYQFLLFIFPAVLTAQDKHDVNWYLGYPTSSGINDSLQNFGGTHVQFLDDSVQVRFFNSVARMSVGATISDKNGNLIFYTNGCRIWNRSNEYMAGGGDQFNYNNIWEGYCSSPPSDAYPASQLLVVLPYPGRPKQYVIFHQRTETGGEPIAAPRAVLYTVIDMNGDGGLGEVIEKDVVLTDTDDYMPGITAVRHGNGRDWWVVSPSYDTKRTYLFLLDPTGVHGPYVQETPDLGGVGSSGQIAFSPNGAWYAESFAQNDTRLTRFDRCAGVFYDFQPTLIDSIYAAGVVFSPNSEVFYLSRVNKIFQYDLTAPDIPASRQVVAIYDGYYTHSPPLRTTFFQGILAPDQRIYLTSTNTVDEIHVIDHPDSLGTACGVRQHGFPLYSYHGFSVPNYPHYRLYDLQGSPCDTLGIDGPVQTYAPIAPLPKHSIQIQPNPAQDWITVLYQDISVAKWQISDLTGRVYQSGQAAQRDTFARIRVSDLPAGRYLYQAITTQGSVAYRSFVVAR